MVPAPYVAAPVAHGLGLPEAATYVAPPVRWWRTKNTKDRNVISLKTEMLFLQKQKCYFFCLRAVAEAPIVEQVRLLYHKTKTELDLCRIENHG